MTNTKSSEPGLAARAASVIGGEHHRTRRRSQDAAACVTGPGWAVVVVCDGCGSAPRSELGAELGAQAWAHGLARALAAGARLSRALWDQVSIDVVRTLGALAAQLGPRDQVVRDSLLFTVVAAAYAGGQRAVFAIGDGAYAVDGVVTTLGPFPDNTPPYPMYGLTGAPVPSRVIVEPAPARGSLLVATDGVDPLPAGELGALADDARLVTHPDALRRHLHGWTAAGEQVDWRAGRVMRRAARLRDDVAVGIIRWDRGAGAGGAAS